MQADVDTLKADVVEIKLDMIDIKKSLETLLKHVIPSVQRPKITVESTSQVRPNIITSASIQEALIVVQDPVRTIMVYHLEIKIVSLVLVVEVKALLRFPKWEA